jgi:hypothetical protein
MSPDDDIKHFLVTRYVARHETTVVEFGADYKAAQDAYQEAERKARGRQDLDVVLLSALVTQAGQDHCCPRHSGSNAAGVLRTFREKHRRSLALKSLREKSARAPAKAFQLRAQQDSNLRPPAPEAGALSTELWAPIPRGS